MEIFIGPGHVQSVKATVSSLNAVGPCKLQPPTHGLILVAAQAVAHRDPAQRAGPCRAYADFADFSSTPFRATAFGTSVGLAPPSNCSVKSSRSSIEPRW